MNDLADRRVLVLGLGVSGVSAANFCAERGARVVAADERPARALSGLSDLDARVERVLGRAFPDPADFDLVVPSPGVPRETPAVEEVVSSRSLSPTNFGGVVSRTVTVWMAVTELPFASVADQITSVVPTGKAEGASC